MDQMFTVRQLGEKIIEKNKRRVTVCQDLKKVYDRVDREMLWQVLESYGVSGRLGRAVNSLYERCQACVRVLGQNSDWFGVEKGERQGCVMSPWLFNLCMDNIVREAVEKLVGRVQLEETLVQLLLFADNLMLVAGKDEDVERNLKTLDEVIVKS